MQIFLGWIFELVLLFSEDEADKAMGVADPNG